MMTKTGTSDSHAVGPRIFLDCSMTSASTSQAGIQRVVRNVARCAPQAAAELGLESRMVVFRDGRWRDVPGALDRVCSSEGPTPSTVEPGSANTTRDARTGTTPTRADSWPARVTSRLYKILFPRTVARAIRRTTVNLLNVGDPVVDFRADDVLLLLDGSWLVSERPRFERARRAGTRIGLVVYDLLPLHPAGYMLPKAGRKFLAWMSAVVPQVDFLIAISRAVRDEYRDWVPSEFPGLPLRADQISWFPLGVKLDLASPTGDVRPDVRAAFDASGPTYLKVCTIEPRKNHAVVLDAFEQVWREHPDARLCFAGRRGWMCDELLARLQNHARFGSHLFWFADLSDAELAYGYRHAYGTVFASLAEGYGLPIAESLQYGLPTFASDIPVHREVGGEYCAWFDPRRSETLARLLLDHLRTGRCHSLRSVAEFTPTTWESSTQALLAECLRLSLSHSSQIARTHAA